MVPKSQGLQQLRGDQGSAVPHGPHTRPQIYLESPQSVAEGKMSKPGAALRFLFRSDMYGTGPSLPSLVRVISQQIYFSHRDEAIVRGNRLFRESTRHKHILITLVCCEPWPSL